MKYEMNIYNVDFERLSIFKFHNIFSRLYGMASNLPLSKPYPQTDYYDN